MIVNITIMKKTCIYTEKTSEMRSSYVGENWQAWTKKNSTIMEISRQWYRQESKLANRVKKLEEILSACIEIDGEYVFNQLFYIFLQVINPIIRTRTFFQSCHVYLFYLNWNGKMEKRKHLPKWNLHINNSKIS